MKWSHFQSHTAEFYFNDIRRNWAWLKCRSIHWPSMFLSPLPLPSAPPNTPKANSHLISTVITYRKTREGSKYRQSSDRAPLLKERCSKQKPYLCVFESPDL